MAPESVKLTRVVSIPRVLEGILGYLSASGAACLLGALRFNLEFWQKCLHPIRDIPEYEAWIQNMLSHGHHVYLIGSDVELWEKRLRDPIPYWRIHGTIREKPLRLWLAVRVNREITRRYSIAADGTVTYKPSHQGEILTSANVIPLPEVGERNSIWPTFQRYEWRVALKTNQNNLQIVFARFADDLVEGTPTVRMCPLQSKDRGPSDLMRDSHDDLCDLHAPSSKLEKSLYSDDQVIPRLPFLDMGSGLYSQAEAIEAEDRKRCSFVVEFRCSRIAGIDGRAKGPTIRADTQGIL